MKPCPEGGGGGDYIEYPSPRDPRDKGFKVPIQKLHLELVSAIE